MNLIEQTEEWRRQFVVNFIDLSEAFDSLQKPIRWNLLICYGLPTKVIIMIILLYDGSTSCTGVGGVNTDRYEITIGVRQSEVLSPIVFIIVVDSIIKRASLVMDF